MSSKWATVTATGPLAVQVDGDTSALPFTPDSLTDPTVLAVGDRVWCEIVNNRVVIVGRTDGVPAASTTQAGVVELATDSETQAGTDTGRAVTPAGLASVFGQAGIPYVAAAGTVASPGGGGSSAPVYWDATATVTLPSGRFSQTPIVTATSDVRTTGGVGLGCSIYAVSSSSFAIRQTRVGVSPSGFYANWVAVQMTPTSGAG